MTYSVIVTYGTCSSKLHFAKGCTYKEAEALQQTAIGNGFRDATIVPDIPEEKQNERTTTNRL